MYDQGTRNWCHRSVTWPGGRVRVGASGSCSSAAIRSGTGLSSIHTKCLQYCVLGSVSAAVAISLSTSTVTATSGRSSAQLMYCSMKKWLHTIRWFAARGQTADFVVRRSSSPCSIRRMERGAWPSTLQKPSKHTARPSKAHLLLFFISSPPPK